MGEAIVLLWFSWCRSVVGPLFFDYGIYVKWLCMIRPIMSIGIVAVVKPNRQDYFIRLFYKSKKNQIMPVLVPRKWWLVKQQKPVMQICSIVFLAHYFLIWVSMRGIVSSFNIHALSTFFCNAACVYGFIVQNIVMVLLYSCCILVHLSVLTSVRRADTCHLKCSCSIIISSKHEGIKRSLPCLNMPKCSVTWRKLHLWVACG